MIRRENCNGWIIISQTDHSTLSGELMKYWGNEYFPKPDPCEEVLFAVREHDNGWREWEQNPGINNINKYPRNFLEMTYKEQSEIWRRSFLRFSQSHPYASSLIALHFDKFNNNICKSNSKALQLKTEISDFVYKNLHMTTGEIENGSDILRNLKYVQIGDIISLALCHGWKTVKLEDIPLYPEKGNTLINLQSTDAVSYNLHPYPFSRSDIKLSVPAKYLPKKTFSGSRELLEFINKSPSTRLSFNISNIQ